MAGLSASSCRSRGVEVAVFGEVKDRVEALIRALGGSGGSCLTRTDYGTVGRTERSCPRGERCCYCLIGFEASIVRPPHEE